jgi:hypothetical protein
MLWLACEERIFYFRQVSLFPFVFLRESERFFISLELARELRVLFLLLEALLFNKMMLEDA